MKVQLIDTLGSDLTVVNAARVSFDKHHKEMTPGDEKLIAYLARHGHWTPFGHPQMQFRISAPLFVARQLVKHQVGLVWNEVSRRYVDSMPEFYITNRWRSRAEDKKQGSGEALVPLEGKDYAYIQNANVACIDAYTHLLGLGVAPEQARMVLPQSMYTEVIATGNLYAWANMYIQRTDSHAQKETQDLAKQIGEIIKPLYPVSWAALVT